ncbi:MAG: hypothetical protein Q4D85_04655 [Corynebacterium sp.]|uniref:hypothetical protein n=1 Tax=Corynebacterium sp. TaxID=1720 RepID=UPI0026DA86CA|nr:hypothetical protein [Corynebacterium sp.]MDO5098029.1 hypothetical protein [Corynebacterium sp.]
MDFLDCYQLCKTADSAQLWAWTTHEDEQLRYAAGRQLQYEKFSAIAQVIEEKLSSKFDPRSWEMMAFIVGQPQAELTRDDIVRIQDILTRLLCSDNEAVVASVICALGHLYSNGLLGEEDFCQFEPAIRTACDRDDRDTRISLLFAIASLPPRSFLADYVLQQMRRPGQDPDSSETVSWALFALEYGPYPFEEVDPLLITIAETVDSDVAAEALTLLVQREQDSALALAEEYCKRRESAFAFDAEIEIHDDLLTVLADSRDERLRAIYQRLNALLKASD